MSTKGLLLKIEVLPGQDEKAENFFRQNVESLGSKLSADTTFIIRFGRSDYGLFTTFTDKEHLDEFLKCELYENIKANEETIFHSHVYNSRLEILAEKLPATPGTKVTRGLMLAFKAKKGHVEDVEKFLKDAKSMVMEEPETTAWFAIRYDDGDYGIFDVFPDNHGRLKHLTGHVPRELVKHALTLLGSIPDIDMLKIV